MEAFEVVNASIPAGTTVTWQNKLKFIPTKWIVVRNSAGMPISDNGFNSWSESIVSLKNTGASDTIVSVIFMR